MSLRRILVASAAVFLVTLTATRGVVIAGSAPIRIHATEVKLLDHRSIGAAVAPSRSSVSRALLGRMIPARVGRAARIGAAAIKIPVVNSLQVLDPTQNFNFNPLLAPGLDSYASEQNFPYKKGFNFSVEPPDPALCVGGGQVIEMVELVIKIFDTSGNLMSGPTDLYSFFRSPNITLKTGGVDSIGLARCYYDAPTSTFFFVATDVGNQQNSPRASALLLAVMPAGATSPTSFVTVSTTDKGPAPTIKHRHCPCFEDQPLIGADANGVYISANEFPLNPRSTAFNGGQIYAFNKADLLASKVDPTKVLVFEAPNNLLDKTKDLDAAASIVPAAATDGVFETANNGTEYFLSVLDFAHSRDDRIAVWALTNTCGIPDSTGATACPFAPTLTSTILSSTAYGIPPDARQKKGLTPVGIACQQNRSSQLNTFDDRMQQVVFANGKLYSALTTILTVNKKHHSGLLYFVIAPSVADGVVSGTITDSNYVASDGLDLFYPAIAATQGGSAVMTFTFSGKSMFPSVGYIPLTTDLGMFEIHTAVTGAGAYDGVSGYPNCGGFPSALWGFNSSAVAANNTMWMATEYVSATCDYATWHKDQHCVMTRGAGSNWGTLVSNLVPPGGP